MAPAFASLNIFIIWNLETSFLLSPYSTLNTRSSFGEDFTGELPKTRAQRAPRLILPANHAKSTRRKASILLVRRPTRLLPPCSAFAIFPRAIPQSFPMSSRLIRKNMSVGRKKEVSYGQQGLLPRENPL